MTQSLHLFDALEYLSDSIHFEDIPVMEDIGQNHGFILYRTFVSGPRPGEKLFLKDVHDRALVFQNGVLLKIVDRNDVQDGIAIEVSEEGVRLDILVENQGRVNYGCTIAKASRPG